MLLCWDDAPMLEWCSYVGVIRISWVDAYMLELRICQCDTLIVMHYCHSNTYLLADAHLSFLLRTLRITPTAQCKVQFQALILEPLTINEKWGKPPQAPSEAGRVDRELRGIVNALLPHNFISIFCSFFIWMLFSSSVLCCSIQICYDHSHRRFMIRFYYFKSPCSKQTG